MNTGTHSLRYFEEKPEIQHPLFEVNIEIKIGIPQSIQKEVRHFKNSKGGRTWQLTLIWKNVQGVERVKRVVP